MAIYHLRCKVSQRSKGKSAIASAAYRRGIDLRNHETNELYNFTNKEEVVYSDFAIPENSPAWLLQFEGNIKTDDKKGVEDFWNYYESFEKRKDSQLTRDFIVALPKELTTEQNIQLAQEFVKDQLAKRGMVADYSIHLDAGNPHLHIAASMRHIVEEGFGEKNLSWNDKTFLKNIRMSWSEYANFHLKMAGHDVRIDHRSYEEMGVDLIPSFHIGRAAYDMERRGYTSELILQAEKVREENLERIRQNPNIIYNKIALQQETFTAHDIVDEVGRYTRATVPNFEEEIARAKVLSEEKIKKILGEVEHHESVFTNRDLAKLLEAHIESEDASVFTNALVELRTSKELIYLGPGDDGRDRYTTRKMFQLENGIQNTVDELKEGRHFTIALEKMDEHLQAYEAKTGKSLKPEQEEAVRYALENKQIGCIVGRAGTGKSFSLGAANAVWNAMGFEVHGVALSGVAADGLDKDAGMSSSTIELFKMKIKSGELKLKRRSVVVMDEAGMTDSVSMGCVMDAVKAAGAKLLLVGDHGQLQPVGPGAVFRAIVERMPGYKELTVVQRQKGWQSLATTHFASGQLEAAMDAYDENGCIHYLKKKEEALTKLVAQWKGAYQSGKSMKEMIALAYTREDVKALNALIRDIRVEAGDFAEVKRVSCERGVIDLAVGDRIVFLKNSSQFGVKNGRFAMVDLIEKRGGSTVLYATLDGDAARKVVIDTAKYKHFDYGYAATVHKTQGITVDRSFLYMSRGWDRCLSYVGMSRHRENCQVFTDLADKEALTKEVKRYAIKDSLFDFAYHFAVRRGLDDDSLGDRLKIHLQEKMAKMTAWVKGQHREQTGEHWQTVKETLADHPEFSKTIEVREKARVVAAYADANKEIGVAYEQVTLKMAELGLKKGQHMDPRMAVVKQGEAYKNMLAYLTHRDRLAHEIVSDLPSYVKAIEVSNIDCQKLKASARRHECREIVGQYLQETAGQKAILRDKTALEMVSSIKEFYPLLLDAKVDTSSLFNQARTHERRIFCRSLNPADRARMNEVERYLALVQEAGAVYVRNATKEQGTDKLIPKNPQFYQSAHYQRIVKERDGLAFKIVSHMEDYNKAVDFYEIGLARPRYGSLNAPNQEAIRKATQRWYKMEEQAANHQVRILLHAYIDASRLGDVVERQHLAHQMLQNKKAAFREFAQSLGPNNTLWFDIHKDAHAFESTNFYKGLSNTEDRALFTAVETFMVARTESRKAWSEALQGHEAPIDFAGLEGLFTDAAKAASRYKSDLARDLLKSYKEGSPIYQHFALDFETLKNEAGFKRVDANAIKMIADYQDLSEQGKEYLKRAYLARVILENKDTLKGPLMGLKVNWDGLYKESSHAYRHYLTNDLLIDYKQELRAIWKYQDANRAAGRAWGEITDLKKEHKPIPATLQATLDRAAGARDAYASQVLNEGHDVLTALFFKNKQDKLEKQAHAHDNRLSLVEQYSRSRKHYLNILKQSVVRGEYKVDFITMQDEMLDLLNPIVKHLHLYKAALSTHGLDRTHIAKDQALFKTYAELAYRSEGFDNTADHHGLLLSPEEQAKIKRAQRILKETCPIEGSVAERYLREHRHITGALPVSCHYHPGIRHFETGEVYPALVVSAQHTEKAMGAPTIQVIYLDRETGNKAKLDTPKLSYGRFLEGSAVLINQGKDNTRIAIAEGPETALSIKEAKPDLTIYAVLGSSNFKKIPISEEIKEIILCADNDYPREPSFAQEPPASLQKVTEAADFFAERGIDVYQIMPKNPKEDFNDVLKNEGVEKVREYLAHPEQLAKGVTIERLEKEVKTQLNIEGDRVHLSKGLTQGLAAYLDAEVSYTEATSQYFGNMKSPNKQAFKQTMDEAAEVLKAQLENVLAKADYQDMMKHAKYETPIGQAKDPKNEHLKKALKTSILSTVQIYKLGSQIESNAKMLGLVQGQGQRRGRSV